MQTEYDVLVGFSVNPEVTWTNTAQCGRKLSAMSDFHLSGTSFDVALVLSSLGKRVFLVGAVGADDPINKTVQAILISCNLPNTLLGVREKTPFAHIEPENNRSLSDKPPVILLPPKELQDRFCDITCKFRVVTGLLSGEKEIQLAKILLSGRGIKVLNPRAALVKDREAFRDILKYTDWLFLNQQEASIYFELGESTDYAKFLELGPSVVIVTKDKEGSELLTKSEKIIIPGYNAGLVIDETGAGDCFLGYLISVYLESNSLKEALCLANRAASIKVTRLGTSNFPNIEEVTSTLVHN